MRRVIALLLLGGLLTSGCSTLPDAGAVHRSAAGAGATPEDLPQFAPPGPANGDSRLAVVKGFLLAMTAVPLSTSVARTFLSGSARAAWNPDRGTLVYQSQSLDGAPGGVRLRLGDTKRLDPRGGWLGNAGPGAGDLDLQLVREGGQWRIANPPDAVIVPQWYLETVYHPYNLYFFDQTERVLVPDRIYVPRGAQSPSTLVRALLAGPGHDQAPVTRSEFPPQIELDLSVQVSAGGLADVPLSRQLLDLPPDRLKRLVAQLAWTLRQVRGLNRIRLTAGETAVLLPDGRRDFSVQEGDAYAPTVQGASDRIFGLQNGRVVGVRDTSVTPVPGPLGRAGFSIRSVTAGLTEQRFAAVAANGSTVFGWTRGRVQRLYDGQDLLRPAYDMFETLWLLDRTSAGARVLTISGGRARVVDVPRVTGRDVRAFLVSRDGTRLVAAVRKKHGARGVDQVVTAEILRATDGTVARAITAHRIASVPSDIGRIVDIAWRSPNDVVVLGRSRGLSQIAIVAVDGSPGDAKQVQPDLYRGRAASLVGSPDSSQPLFLATDAGLLRLSPEGHWVPTTQAKGVQAPAYAG